MNELWTVQNSEDGDMKNPPGIGGKEKSSYAEYRKAQADMRRLWR